MCDKCTAVCSCTKTLKLEVGKTYLCVNGNKYKILGNEQHPVQKDYKWAGINLASGNMSWFTDAGNFNCNTTKSSYDLVKEYREPAVRYMNEYADGFTNSTYNSKEDAIIFALSRALRKGVKFVEVIEDGTNNA